MGLERFLIAPLDMGQQTNMRPWQIMDKAWFNLANMYPWRGRLRKRWGTIFSSQGALIPDALATRLKVPIGTTDGSGNLALTTFPTTAVRTGSAFSAGNVIFTVTTVPLVVGNAATLSSNSGATGTLRLDSTGPNVYQFQIAGGLAAIANTTVYWYPTNPVMGMNLYQSNALNDDPTYIWDTQFAYSLQAGSWERLGTAVWTGNDAAFFWSSNYRGSSAGNAYLFVTNNNVTDGIKYWDGAAWNNMTISLGVGRAMQTARIVVPFHNRLVFLNTTEDGTNYATRARFSAIGNPIENGGTSYFPWYDNPNAANWIGGGFEDNIQTQQQIVSAQFIRDRLIVWFEASVWELVYTGNQILPFRWQQINPELGAESTFSTVPQDRIVTTFGNVGIHSCTGATVDRIDDFIPDTIFDVSNLNSGPQRVVGIRDYFFENMYWTYPSAQNSSQSQTYPNQILVYNYKTGTWAFFDDSFTFFGYFQQQSSVTWAANQNLWGQEDATWAYPNLDARNLMILGGNQQGYILKIRQDIARNAAALQITNMASSGDLVTCTVINHNLRPIDIATQKQTYVLVENIPLTDPYAVLNGGIYPVYGTPTSDSFVIRVNVANIIGTYNGGGTIARVNNITITSKAWNFYKEQGKNFTVNRIEFNVDKTAAGSLTVDAYPSFTNISTGAQTLDTYPYTTIYPLEQYQDQLWHPVYFNVFGETVQISMYMSDDQMQNPDSALTDIQIHALMIFITPTGRLQ